MVKLFSYPISLVVFCRSLCDKSYKGEIDNFNRLAKSWWNLNGPFYALHSMNELRIPWIVDKVSHINHSKCNLPLDGLKILDVGCGGGILSIPLAKLGATVTGIDLSEECISTCEHIVLERFPQLKLNDHINFKCCSIEELAFNSDEKYDVVIASEVVEHVDELNFFIKGCSDITKMDGHIFITTINRTLLSLILAKFTAEYILRIVPRGIHTYSKFVKPYEIKMHLLKNGFTTKETKGLFYNFFNNSWSWTTPTLMNYAVYAVKTCNK